MQNIDQSLSALWEEHDSAFKLLRSVISEAFQTSMALRTQRNLLGGESLYSSYRYWRAVGHFYSKLSSHIAEHVHRFEFKGVQILHQALMLKGSLEVKCLCL